MSDLNEKLLKKLIAERDRLLAENPHLASVQIEYERRMELCGDDPIKRAREAQAMMKDVCENELLPELEDLQKTLEKVKESVEENEVVYRKNKTGS